MNYPIPKGRGIKETLMNKLRDALILIRQSAEEHPLFMGYEEDGMTRKIIDVEGGDSAFVTLDIAWVAKEALDAYRITTKQSPRRR